METLKTMLFLIGAVMGFFLGENQTVDLNSSQELQDVFQLYQQLNNKQYYSPQEQDYRYKVFVDNAKFLLGDLSNINNKIKLKEQNGNKMIVVANHNPCQEELALNNFMDQSNLEFQQNYLLQPNFFDTKIYKPKDKIYFPEFDNFQGFSYYNNQDWITSEIDSVLQDPDFDIFDETLKYRQNNLQMHQPDCNYSDFQMHNDLLGFTKHDDKYLKQQIKMFLYNTMPNYEQNFQYQNQQDDQEDQKLQEECLQYMKQQQQGRRLQYYNFNSDSFWDKYYDQLDTNQPIEKKQNYNQYYTNDTSQIKLNQNQNQQQRQIQKKSQQQNTNHKQNTIQQQEDFVINESTKVYKTKTNPPKYIAVTNGKIKTFDYDPKLEFNQEEQRKKELIAQIKQMIQKNNNKQRKNIQQKPKQNFQSKINIDKPKQTQQNYQQNSQSNNNQKQSTDTIQIEGVTLPKYVNWRQQGEFTPVKNQRKCNACYAFGALATLETHISLKYQKLLSLSEQEIVDCSPGNQACNGGQPYLVYDYIKENGVNLQQDYRYIARKQMCRRRMDLYRYKQISGRIFVKPGMINLLKAVNFGPVAVVSHASDFLKYFYDGTFTGRGCYNKKTPNHASMLYGYNLNAPQPYLLFKNNWGEGWGNRGYYKVTIGELSNRNLGHCLIAETTFNVIPII